MKSNPTNTPQDAVERVEARIKMLESGERYGADPALIEGARLFAADLRTLLSLTKPDEEMVARVTRAIEEETVERQGRGHYLITGHNDSEALARAAIKAITLDLYDGES